MANTEFSLLCIGNALVDVLAHADDDFLKRENIAKGSMTLIEEDHAKNLYDKMEDVTVASGGSAANTVAGFASLGGNAAFIGKVAEDVLGEIFASDMETLNVHYQTPKLYEGPETGRCYIIVTPDAERSMSTFLGASIEFGEEDINKDLIAKSDIIYLEGYLFDKEKAKNAYHLASKEAHKHDRQVALTLSDTFCVERHRDDFLDLISSQVDILFANEHELKALYPTLNEEESYAQLQKSVGIAAITQSENGVVVISGSEIFHVPALKVKKVVDTTGAGDQFAAGFLYGLSVNHTLETCAKLGHIAAGEVISHMGPRPERDLAELLDNSF